MWERFLNQHNGTTMLLPQQVHSQQSLQIGVISDQVGWATTMGSAWVTGTWGPILLGKKASLGRSLVPWLALFQAFGHQLANSNICLQPCDPLVAMVLGPQTHKDPLVMRLVRIWVLNLLSYNTLVHFSPYTPLHNSPITSSIQVSTLPDGLPHLLPAPSRVFNMDWPDNCP